MTNEAKRCVYALQASIRNGFHSVGSAEFSIRCTEMMHMIESLSNKNKQLEYTLVGVMHFVDKWLDGIEPYSLVDDPSGQIAIDRAAEARRITLEHIEDLTREMYRRGQELCGIKEGEN